MTKKEPSLSDPLLVIYQLHAEGADRVSALRNQTNHRYLTLNVAAYGGAFALAQFLTEGLLGWFLVLGGVFGMLLCLAWLANIRSYRQLNGAKFKVLLDLEKQLPYAFYTKEWEALRQEEEPMYYRALTKVERFVPGLFSGIYLCLVGLGICLLLS